MHGMTPMGMVATPGNCLLMTVRKSLAQRIGRETMQVHRDLWQFDAL